MSTIEKPSTNICFFHYSTSLTITRQQFHRSVLRKVESPFFPQGFPNFKSHDVYAVLEQHRPPSVPIGFVPQKLGLIWWVPWECKNLGELNFHMENGLPEAQKLPNRYYHMSRSQENWSEFFSVHYWGCGRQDNENRYLRK